MCMCVYICTCVCVCVCVCARARCSPRWFGCSIPALMKAFWADMLILVSTGTLWGPEKNVTVALANIVIEHSPDLLCLSAPPPPPPPPPLFSLLRSLSPTLKSSSRRFSLFFFQVFFRVLGRRSFILFPKKVPPGVVFQKKKKHPDALDCSD